ncbi:MAG: LptA/OstA family protein [Pseudomonadota bacterium]
MTIGEKLRRIRIVSGAVGLGMIFLCGAASPASAQLPGQESGDNGCDEPLDVGGDLLEVIDNVATLTGDVRVVQCDSVLATPKLVGTQNEDGAYETLEAFNGVRYSDGDQAISSRTARYDLETRVIVFTDNVVVVQGEQIMTGGRLVYTLDTGAIRFTAPPGRRIRGLIQTGGDNANPFGG